MEQKPLKNTLEFSRNVRFLLIVAPPPEKCFSIIGPTTVDGEKSFNVECDSPEEANRWIEYLEIVASFFKKNQQIKTSLVKK
jgi:hypothetical protein